MLRVLVPIKRVIDSSTKVTVLADKTGVAKAGVKFSINPFCEIALEEAIRLKDKAVVGEVTTVTIGNDKAAETIRNSYSFGVDHGIHVLTSRETDRDLQPLAVAHVLRQLVQQKKYDLVLLGKQSVDDDFNQTGQLLARLLGWPQVTFISKMDFLADEKSFLFEREIDGGIQKLKAPVNSVVTCDLRLNKPRQPKVAAIMKGRSKPIESLKLEDFQIPTLEELKVLSFAEPRKRTGGVMVKDVDELLAKLRTEAKVI